MPAPSVASGAVAKRPVVVFCHGNQATIDYFAPKLDPIRTGADVSLVLFSYRGYGRSSSISHVTRSSTVADSEEMLASVLDRPDVDPDRVFVMGYSLGGVPALAASAREPRVRGVIVGGTYARSADALADSGYGWASGLIGSDFDPATSIAKLGKRPVFIFHGANDTTPKPYHAYELAAAAARAEVPVTVLIVPNAGHFTAAEQSFGTLDAISEFIRKNSPPSS